MDFENEIEPNAPLTPVERVCLGAFLFWPLAFVLLVAWLVGGCVYKGGKVTEGTDLAVGLNVPMSEGCLQLQVLNYLSGFRVGVDRNAIMTIKYTMAETNDYFGCVHTKTHKTADVTVEPCEQLPSDRSATDGEESATGKATP